METLNRRKQEFILMSSKAVSMLTPCLLKLFHLSLLASTLPAGSMPIQSVPKKGDRSCPFNYGPIALLSCISNAFEIILLKHLSTFNLLSDHKYGFHKMRSIGAIAFLTDFWPSSFNRRRNFCCCLRQLESF